MRTSGRSSRLVAAARSSWPAAALFVASFLVFSATAGYAVSSSDVWAANFGSWLMVNTGSQQVDGLAMPPLDSSPMRHVWIYELDDGTEVIARAAGVIIAGIPAYWLFGSSAFSLLPGAITAAFLSALSLVFLYACLSPRLKRREAVLAAVVVGFTTPVWSVGANGLWPHTLTTLGIAGMAWAASRDRWLLVGLFGVVCLWGRPQTAVLILVLGVLVGLLRRDWRIIAKVGVVSAVGLMMLSWWNQLTFGSYSPLGNYDATATLELVEEERGIVNQLGMWIAPDRGILIWTPVILVLLPAVVRSWRNLPDWSRALVWAGVCYTLVHAWLVEFTGGDSFYGYRFTLELLVCLSPAFALSARQMGPVARLLFAPVLGVQTCVILVGAVNDVLLVPVDRVWRDHSFVVVMSDSPVTTSGLLVVSVAVAALARRVWLDPGLPQAERARASETSLRQ